MKELKKHEITMCAKECVGMMEMSWLLQRNEYEALLDIDFLGFQAENNFLNYTFIFLY